MSVDIEYGDKEPPIKVVKAEDAIAHRDYIEARANMGTSNSDIRLQIEDTTSQDMVYLSKEDAIEFGKALINMGEQA